MLVQDKIVGNRPFRALLSNREFHWGFLNLDGREEVFKNCVLKDPALCSIKNVLGGIPEHHKAAS